MSEMVRKTLSHDIEMLKLLAVLEKKAVAQKYELTPNGLDAWLTRIRRRRIDARWYENSILNLEKRDSRMRKILLSDRIGVDLEA